MSATGDWSAAALADAVGLIIVRVGAWNHLEYPENVPGPGEHSAEAIRAGHGAIEVIDEAIRELQEIRGLLVAELRQDEDARAARVDAMLAEARARRDGAAAPLIPASEIDAEVAADIHRLTARPEPIRLDGCTCQAIAGSHAHGCQWSAR